MKLGCRDTRKIIGENMTNEEARETHRRYSELGLTNDERNAICDCYMQGINRDGHVWVTWTDVERLVCDLMGVRT